MEITVGLALLAGFVSFISPCVLPLVPAYIGYMGGRMSSTAVQGAHSPSLRPIAFRQRINTFIHGIFFVMGFSLIFVTIGLLSTAFVQQIGGSNVRVITDLIGRLGGILIVVFGLHFMGVLLSVFQRLRALDSALNRPVVTLAFAVIMSFLIVWGFNGDFLFWNSFVWATVPGLSIVSLGFVAMLWGWMIMQRAFTEPAPFILGMLDRIETALYSDTRRTMVAAGRNGYLDSFVMGVVFSAGWTPCIGPVYGAVLTLAANGGDVGKASILLAVYSLGLGIPFLLTALLLDGAQVWLKRLQRRIRIIELASGALLVLIGIAVASGQLQKLSQQFAGDFAEFSISVEERVIGLVMGSEISLTAPASDSSTTVDDSTTIEDIGLEIGNFAPDFETLSAAGEPIVLSSLRGNVVLLNFWATWCGPCRIEMPGFERQYRKFSDQGFIVLAVNNAESVEMAAAFRDQLRLTFPIAMDQNGDIQRQYGIVNYPSTLLLDREGRIVSRHFGVVPLSEINAMLVEMGFTP